MARRVAGAVRIRTIARGSIAAAPPSATSCRARQTGRPLLAAANQGWVGGSIHWPGTGIYPHPTAARCFATTVSDPGIAAAVAGGPVHPMAGASTR